MLDQHRGHGPPRHPNRQALAQPEQHVVPALGGEGDRRRKPGELRRDEARGQFGIDGKVGARKVHGFSIGSS
jgi:hypothetical protein